MNIGVDIDGVILDTERWVQSYGEIFDVEVTKKGVLCPDAVLTQDKYEWDKEQLNQFIDKYGFYCLENTPLMPCCKMVLDWLRDQGHKLIIVTARGKWGEQEEGITYRTLEKYDLKFDKVFLNCSDKAKVCIENDIDYMIEDSPSNIDRLDFAGVKCLYMRDKDRKKYDSKNVIEVANWGAIYRFFIENKYTK